MAKTTADRRVKRIDMDAAARERSLPEGLVITMSGQDYELPAELPIDVFDPFLTDDLDLVDLARTFYEIVNVETKEIELSDALLELLEQRPGLHKQIIGAIRDAVELLFGPEQFTLYKASRPTVPGFIRLVSALADEYGVALGELFASPDSSKTAGATQKAISEPTTDSTSATPESDTETTG